VNGTFGEDAETAKRNGQSLRCGVQNGEDGLKPGSVITVVKHWAGYGAAKHGWDSHNSYGRFASFAGHNFAEHLVRSRGAFEAHAAA